MSFAVIGVNHKNCPVEVRERVAFTHSKVLEGLNKLKAQGIKEVVILSTCNRSEIYIEDDCIKEGIIKIQEFYEKIHQQNNGEGKIKPYLFVYEGHEAVEHLFRVSVGLDSIVLGEDQILSQVKKAYYDAITQGTSGKMMHKVFREAICLAKKVKNEIKISEQPLSISHIAIQFLKEKQGTLKEKKGLIIGLGQMSELTIKYLKDEALSAIYVTNRTHGKVVEMQKIYGGIIPVRYQNRYEILNEVDFVISATASTHTILSYEKMPPIKKRLDIMDIAMPRDIDESINALPYVNVYHIDYLKQIAEKNSEKRSVLSQQAEGMIKEGVLKWVQWVERLPVEKVAGDIECYCEKVKMNTIQYLKHKSTMEIDEETLDKVMNEVLKRCMRTPIAKLMAIGEKEKREVYIHYLRELFEIVENTHE